MTEPTKAPGIKEQEESAVNKQKPDANLIMSDRHLEPGEEPNHAVADNEPSDKPRGGDSGYGVEGMGKTEFSKGGQYVPEKKKAAKAEKSDK